MTRKGSRKLGLVLLACVVTGPSAAAAGAFENAVFEPPGKTARIERGLAHIYGFGVKRDHVRALMWFILADSRNHYRLVADYMTATQISHAAALAEICEESRFTDCE